MSPSLALALCGLFAAWLVRRDLKERESVSGVVWIVTCWAIILGSRPVTSWLTGDFTGQEAAARDEGNPQEALFYIALEVAGLFVLMHRRVRLSLVMRENRCLAIFYAFWLASVLWSDYPVITIKRLVKDLGNVIMVLVLLTEASPVQAVKAAFVRCAYICIPLSILLIKYYPDLGRAYAGYNKNDLMYVGVALHKNTLGALALVSALFLLWDLLHSPRTSRTSGMRLGIVGRGLVLLMSWRLLLQADSATALVCAVFGSSLLIAFRLPALKRVAPRLAPYGLAALPLVFLLDSMFNLKERIILGLGRDMTFTTRTDIWPIVVRYADNPLLGAGFNTFWAGSRLVELHQYDVIGGIIQAHNGYLETYLNGGWMGIGLLVTLLLVSHARIQRELALHTPESLVRFIALLVALLYNFSEASFNKLSLVWLVTLFAMTSYTLRPAPAVPATRDTPSEAHAH
jgi:O-antigen ligase